MKTVNVFVCIQMDIPNQDEDQVSEVQRVLDSINEDLQQSSPLGSNAQIFVSDVDSSNIVSPQPEFEIGDSVEVPDPDDSDIHNHSFVGVIKNFRNGNAVVEDGDGDCFEIEMERLTLLK
jgi:hypothetical protein